MFNHYFIDKNHEKSDFFNFKYDFLGKNFNFTSVDNIFSKNTVDLGSLVLINTIIKNFDLNNKLCLDLGCGFGAIGILLKNYFKKSDFVMSDITETAVNLTKINLEQNNLTAEVVKSDLFENIDKNFDFIISNPPIKTGKKLLFNLLEESFNHLNANGKLVVVIKKNLGEESLKKKMEEIFSNAEILKRDKGYYIIESCKNA